MNQSCQLAPINLSDSTQLDSLVEHRRVFNLKHCELNIFETFHKCDNVRLSYNGLVVSSMMRGKKIMSLSDSDEFDFLPGESVILPEGVSMKVDFPEADVQHPVQCDNVRLSYNGLVVSSMMRGKKIMSLSDSDEFDFLPGESVILPEGVSMKVDFPEADVQHPVQCATLALDWDMVNKNLAFLNENYPNSEAPFEWKLNFSQYHFLNNKELAGSINKLISISMEDNVAKDGLADLSLKFLLLRIIQTQHLAEIKAATIPQHHFTPVVQYIKEHLTEKISIDILARESCMSRSAFFNAFKKQFGRSPLEYVQQERISHAKQVLADATISITDACYQSGFNNLNYFIRLFKRMEGVTPSAYRK